MTTSGVEEGTTTSTVAEGTTTSTVADERLLETMLELKKHNVAQIIISHRLGSLMHADEILFLESGRIVERGSHEQLLKLGGRYRELYELQVHGRGDTAATDYFRRKTNDKLYAAFKPVVSQKVNDVGVTRAYKEMIGRYESVPLVSKQSLDIDDYAWSGDGKQLACARGTNLSDLVLFEAPEAGSY